MFKFGKEALYERIIQEKVHQIDILCDQIEYLRAQLALRGIAVPGAAVNPSEQPSRGMSAIPLVEVKNHVSDEELDAEALMDSGLSETEIKSVLEEFGLSGIDNIEMTLG